MSNRAMMRGVINSPEHDPHWDKVVSLLHFDGANNSTVFSDVKGLSWTGSGDAKLTTSEKKFGTASVKLENSEASYISCTDSGFAAGEGDFTCECFFYTVSSGLWQCVFGNGADSSSFRVTFTSLMTLSTNGADPITGGSATKDVWHHIAVTRASGTWRLFLDGTGIGTYSASNDLTNTVMKIGSTGSEPYLDGYIDEFRFTNGVARYTSDFTPPQKFYPNR